MSAIIHIQVNEELYVRDPQETELGRRILADGVRLMDELGFEGFTFRKLAAEIASTEASIYRYFTRKQQFLKYLTAWYWNWLSYVFHR